MTITQAQILALWAKIKTNPVFVAAYTAAAGASASIIQDALTTGHVDWKKLFTVAGGAAIAAVVHLYIPAPSQGEPKQ